MGAAGSSSFRLHPAPRESTNTGFGNGENPSWSLPSACHDDVWLKVDLSMVVGTGAGLTGKGGGDFGRAIGERRRDGNVRDNQAAWSSQPNQNSSRDIDEEDDWLEASLCLSMSALNREEVTLLVARAKNKLLRTLSCLCSQDDAFCDAVAQRIQVLQCVHAAMSRKRRAQLERDGGGSVALLKSSVVRESDEGVAGVAKSACPTSGDDLLGLQLFFSLLDFVRDPECGQEQLADFLQQIAPVLSSLPPLCLADSCSGLSDDMHGTQPTRRTPAPGVVHSLREFLVTVALEDGVESRFHQEGDEPGNDFCRHSKTPQSGHQEVALSAMISLVGARGRASDLLLLVKVLLSARHQKLDEADVFRDKCDINIISEATGSRGEHVVAECSAKRRPISRTKARTSRQGLPVDDDDDDEVDADVHDQEIHDSPLLEHPVVSLGVGPAEPATGRNVTGDPWQSETRAHVSNEGDGVKPPEGYQVKGKKGKGGVVKFSTPVDRQPWEKSEHLSDLHALDLPPVVGFVDDEACGVEAKCILPLLRQLSAAMPIGESRLGKASIVHEREVWTCGQNSYGELGHNDTGTRMVHCPVKSFESMEVVDVAAGNEHTVFLCRSGEVFTAGYNDNGQCGQGTTQRVGVLTRIPNLAGRRAVQVHAYNGCEHTLVVLDDGQVVSFGYNYRGQLGHGNTTSESVPKPVRGLEGIRVTQVSCSYYHSVVACDNGEVYTFGRNDFGQLGSGDTIDRKLPSLVDSLRGQRVTSLACGQYHTVVSTLEIGVQSCGKNDYGQLGVESPDFQKHLVIVKGALDGAKVKHLRCGYYHTIVLLAGEHVLGFGRNDYGQLGLGHITQRVFGPQLIEGAEGKGVCRVSAGCYHTVLIGSDGMLYVFGRNHHGQLGTGDTNERHSPFPVDTFLGKRVAKVAAGFYHTIILTGGDDEESSELNLSGNSHSLSPHNILAHPALALPHDESSEHAAEAVGKNGDQVASEALSPEMSSPVCNRGGSNCPREPNNVGFRNSREPKAEPGSKRGIRRDDGQVSRRKAAVVIMAHMDRLAESFASPTGELPIIGNAGERPADEETRRPRDGEGGGNQRGLYCVDVSPETFELLAAILASTGQEQHFGSSGEEAHFQAYILLAALRILKVNLARLIRSDISTHIVTSMGTQTTSFDLNDANELQLEGTVGHDPVLYTVPFDSPNDGQATSAMGGTNTEPGTAGRSSYYQYNNSVGKGGMNGEGGNIIGPSSEVDRYRNVLCSLQQRLLLLIESGAEHIQKEAATVLILGLELFFSGQAEQFRLLSKLINMAAIDDDEQPELVVGGDPDSIDRSVYGPRAARHYILAPLLRRLCNDALAWKLIPYGTNVDEGRSVCTMTEVSEPALKGYRVAAASARLLEMQVTMLVDLIAQGDTCDTSPGEPFAKDVCAAAFMPQHQGGSPSSVLQLNGSATNPMDSFHLDVNATNSTLGDDHDSPARTQHLYVDLVLMFTKHIMHWAAGDQVTVDPALWQSRVLNSVLADGYTTGATRLEKGVPVDGTTWLATRVKGLCDRAASVILDGVDCTPSSWRCLIKHAQLVLKYSTAILETALEGDSEGHEGNGGAAEVGDGRSVDGLEDTLVGLLLPAVVTGLLPFAHIPVFARRLMDVVITATSLLDEACYRCAVTRLADANYIAARNGDGEASASKRKPQTLFMRGENGKLGSGATTSRTSNVKPTSVDTGVASKGTTGASRNTHDLPWLLSLAKTTALLAGKLASTLVVGDCGISPFLESYFRSPAYSRWMESDLFTGGCDPSYEGLMLGPLDIASRDEKAEHNVVTEAKDSTVSPSGVKDPAVVCTRSREELREFLEEVAGGYGQGGRLRAWLIETYAPSSGAYRTIKRQAEAGRDGEALERAERAMMAAMLRHGGLEGDASLFAAGLGARSGGGIGKGEREPPQRLANLWKSTAEVACWLWESRSKLKSADADRSKIDALLEGAANSSLVLLLFKPAGCVPPALVAKQKRKSDASSSALQLAAQRRWRKAMVVVRAMIRWRSVIPGRILKQSAAAVPRFVRAMLRTNQDPPGLQELSEGEGGADHDQSSVECLSILLILILDNHQRAVARASGLRSLYALAGSVRMRSLRADVLVSLPPTMQTPRLVDRHILTHMSAVGRGVILRVTEAFQALLGELLRLLEESYRSQEGAGKETDPLLSNPGGTTSEGGLVPMDERQSSFPRQFDARMVLVLLEVWGLTIRSEDWGFVETAGAIRVISLVASARLATEGHAPNKAGVCIDANVCRDITMTDEVVSKRGNSLQSLERRGSSGQKNLPFATCCTAACTLFRALIIQLHGMQSTTRTKNIAGQTLPPIDSIMEVLRTELNQCIMKEKSKFDVNNGGPRRGRAGGGGVGSHRRDRTPSQAILEFAPPLIGGFPDSPMRSRATAGGKLYGGGVSHKRRCQELVTSARRLINMEDGLMFPAEHVLNNPRGSDFSITFWLLLAQDRTGHHRTVLARGRGSERWPVVLLRNTDNRLEVCFGIPSMGNLCERLTSKEPVQINRWTHVGLISEHNKLRLYFNGVLDCQRTSTGALRANRHPLYVGKVPDGAMRLDGVRGGVEGSIANLRFFTRALSPIHVRIICDPGPPEAAKVEDRRLYHLCACLVPVSTSPQCRRYLQHPDWLKLFLQAFTHGTMRVQQATCRLLREILPQVDPTVMANVRLDPTGSHATDLPPAPNAKGNEDDALQTAFTVYLLRLAGASSWHIRASISTADGSVGASPVTGSEEERETTVEQVLRGEKIARFLPRTIAAEHIDGGSVSGTMGVEGESEASGGGLRKIVEMAVTGAHRAPAHSAETAHDASTIGAELVALVQVLAATEVWGKAVALALKESLAHLTRFVDTIGGFTSPNRSDDCGADRGCATVETRLAIAGGEAVLHVLGGTIDFLCAGACATVRETDQRCTVLSVDQATSTVSVVFHPKDGAATENWVHRFGAQELEVQVSDSLARGAMNALSGDSSLAARSDGEASGYEYIIGIATAFLRSSPLPRSNPTSGKEYVHHAHTTYREIVLAQSRSRLARAVLRASRSDRWASKTVETTGLLEELLRVSVLRPSTTDGAIRAGSLAKAETVAIQERLHQMLATPGGAKIVMGKIAEMVLNPEERTFTRERGINGDGEDESGRERDGPNHRSEFSSTGRAWVDSLSCPFCHEENTTVSGLVEHVLTRHSTDMRRVPCPVCVVEKGESMVHDLPTHLELVHLDAILRDTRPFLPAFTGRRRGASARRQEVRPPSHLVEQLMVIGFPEDWCTMALRENDNDVVNASAWIVDNLDMLSSLNNLDVSSPDNECQADDVASSLVHDESDGQLWQGSYRFARERLARERLARREEREFGDNLLAQEQEQQQQQHQQQQQDFERRGGRSEEKYQEEEDLGGADSEEEGEERTEEGEGGEEVEEEDEDEDDDDEEDEDDEDDEDDDDDDAEEEEEEGEGDDQAQDEDGVEARQNDEAFDSEEEDEEEEQPGGVEENGRGFTIHGIEHHQQSIVVPPPRPARDNHLDDEQHEIVENRRIADGLVVSDHREAYFPLERPLVRTPDDFPHSGRGSSKRSQRAAANSRIAGMELSQLTEVWLHAELQLTGLYCRAALVNVLLRWPLHVPLSTASLGSSAMVVELIQSMLYSGQDLPISFTDDDTRGRVLQPVPNGARAPKVLGVFVPLLVHLLRSEHNTRCATDASSSGTGMVADAEGDSTLAGSVRDTKDSVAERGDWRNTLSARLVSACLDGLDAAADTFIDVPWAAIDRSSPSNRLAEGGKPNIELLQWLLDLLLSANCAEVFTENVFSRLSNCLNSPNVAAKEVAMYALTSVANKWCEHLSVDSDHRHGDDAEVATESVGLPSPLAMEETFQRHMAISRVRSALAKRIAVERRPGGLFFTKFTQTLTALYVAMCKLQRLLLCRRRQSGCSQFPGEVQFVGNPEVSTPTILYCTDSSVALTWLPMRNSASSTTVLYEVQMAARQLGAKESQGVFRSVYAGKRLRCRVEDLLPGQAYRFRLRAIHPTTQETAWSAVATAETEQGIAFRFDSANSGPAIFVSGNELSASFGSNETWSTILCTTPFCTGSNYWELRLDKSATAYLFIGVATRDADLTTFLGGDDNGWGFIGDRALYHKRTKVKAYGERFGQGDTIGVTLNMDRGTLSFSKNGQDLGVAFEGLVGNLYPAVAFYNQGQRLSLVQSAFRCPGAGVAILTSPLNTTPEDVSTMHEVMEAMVSRKKLPRAWMEVVRAGHLTWMAGKTVRYATSLGFELQFDVSDTSCRRFGLKARGRVRTPRGNATVIGICEGVMWFHVDGECGAWFFTAGEIWEGRAAGCFAMSSSDALSAHKNAAWKRWRVLDGQREEGKAGTRETLVKDAQEAGGGATGAGAIGGCPEGAFAAVRDCARWTPAVDGCIVAALCDYADSHQVSVWNCTPAEVLNTLSPIRRKLEFLLASERVDDDALLCRVSVLKQLNHDMVGVLPFADLAEGVQVSDQPESRTFCWGGHSTHRGLAVGVGGNPTRGLGPLVVCLRRSIFLATKQQTLSQAVSITTTHAKKADDEYDYPEDLPQITVNRMKAAAGQESSDAETRLRTSVFYQLYRELHDVDTSLLRMGYMHPMDDGQQRTFKVKFEGEGVDDYGGPYREIFTQVASELTSMVSSPTPSRTDQTPAATLREEVCLIPILEPVPGSDSGTGRDVGVEFMVKTDSRQQRHLRIYRFLGKLMGIALRCRVAAPWRLSQVFWKGLVGEALQEADLAHVDVTVYAFVQGIRERIAALEQTNQQANHELSLSGSAENAEGSVFERALGDLTWTAPIRGRTVELRPGGREAAVKQSELTSYVHEVAQTRLRESDMALFAMRDGFASVVPTAVLPLFTWEEAELQACGRPGVNIDLLQANTEYDDDVSSSDPHIQSLWRVLRAFDDRDRSQFLRFVWARSRLPTKAADFHQKFKIHSPTGEGAREDPDQYLPKAHTCFFSINLPRYSSDEVMAKKLSYTMYNCVEMDADFRLADNEMPGWENNAAAAARSGRGQSGGDSANFADQMS